MLAAVATKKDMPGNTSLKLVICTVSSLKHNVFGTMREMDTCIASFKANLMASWSSFLARAVWPLPCPSVSGMRDILGLHRQEQLSKIHTHPIVPDVVPPT